jgi:hypothetical protein
MESSTLKQSIDGRIARHEIFTESIAFFNKDGNCLAIQDGHCTGLSSIADYFYTAGFREGTQRGDASSAEAKANSFFFSSHNERLTEPEDLDPVFNHMPLYQMPCKLPHRPREDDETEEYETRGKRQRLDSDDSVIILSSDVSDNNSIQIIEDLSTPAPRRYRIESDYDLGPDSDNENPAVNKLQIESDYELGTDEEQQTDNERDLTDNEDDEVERLMDQTERLLDNIHRKLNNLLEADTDKDYDADSEDF